MEKSIDFLVNEIYYDYRISFIEKGGCTMNMNNKLREYIQENGLKYAHISKKTGIDYRKMSRIINGHTKLTVEEFEMICEKGLNVKPSIFFE
jgi:DNA-binding Xre family transcriptional regulator